MNTLEANWVWMICTSLAWSLKAWMALYLNQTEKAESPNSGLAFWPEKNSGQSDSELILKMEFETFLNNFMLIPVRVVAGRGRIIYDLLGYNEYLPTFVRLIHALE